MPSVDELKAQAKARGLTGYSKLKKEELVGLLSSAPAPAPTPVPTVADVHQVQIPEFVPEPKKRKVAVKKVKEASA